MVSLQGCTVALTYSGIIKIEATNNYTIIPWNQVDAKVKPNHRLGKIHVESADFFGDFLVGNPQLVGDPKVRVASLDLNRLPETIRSEVQQALEASGKTAHYGIRHRRSTKLGI